MYTRKVQYYETDMMGIAHHANYIHWMEEARIDFMDQLGFPYAEMERRGVLSPVKKVTCEYRRSCTFGEEISISAAPLAFNGVVLTIGYEMRSAAGETIFTAQSEHVFLTREGRFVRMQREMPDFCAAVRALLPAEEDKQACSP